MGSTEQGYSRIELFEIAGLRFAISLEGDYPLFVEDSSYLSFRSSVAGASRDGDVDVRILPWAELGKETSDVRFEASGSWTYGRSGQTRVWKLSRRDVDETPFCVVQWNPEKQRVTIRSKEYSPETISMGAVYHPFRYPVDQLVMMDILSNGDGVILHAAGVEIGGKGFVFPGRSGAGKSTLTAALRSEKEICVLSDDRIIVRKVGEEYLAFGTPWPGEAGIALNRGVPLKHLYFIRHGAENSITPLADKDLLSELLPIASVPWYDEEAMTSTLEFCSELTQAVPAAVLDFLPGPAIASFLLNQDG